MDRGPASTFRREIASAYAVTGSRLLSWVIVSAIVFRRLGPEALGVLTLVRATVGILSYTSLGLGPAMVKMLADAASGVAKPQAAPVAALAVDDNAQASSLLAYSRSAPAPAPARPVARIYVTGESIAVGLGVIALVAAAIYASFFSRLHGIAGDFRGPAQMLVIFFGGGIIFRLISDAPSALLQARHKIGLDNTLLAVAELTWGAWTAALLWHAGGPSRIADVGTTFLMVNILLLIARAILGRMEVRALTSASAKPERRIARQLLTLGLIIVLAQAADFLYAPTDCILINQLIGSDTVAFYSPAIQIDAALLMLVSGLAAVLYPRSSIAHAAGDFEQIRRYYIRGTLVSAALLLVASLVIWALSKWIFLLWFHDPMQPTRVILPLLLIHTVIGGSSAVGRSILLAMGKARAFTVAVLVTGTGNVILSYLLVRYAHLGLRGIVLGTIIAVVARCALWMPLYVAKTFREVTALVRD